MTTTNLNQSPYYDDFDPAKNFHQILFKPGYSVQARELTQLQSILQEQVRKFGNHIFTQGAIVIPGNSFIDTNVAYVKVDATNFLAADFDGIEISNAAGVKAIVRHIEPASGIEPITLYISYVSGGTNSENTFLDEDVLTTPTGKTCTAQINSSTGYGSMAFINAGVYYINGHFVEVPSQKIVISRYTQTPSASVLLKITEEIVTADSDTSLQDPAQGSYNYAAPGADRLKISLTLVSQAVTASITADYVEIIRVVDGTIQFHSRFTKYSELEKNLARRTSDESGDYIVSGFDVKLREHLKSGRNDGYYEAPVGDTTKMLYEVSSGKAYIDGFEVDSVYNRKLVVDKARTDQHVKLKESISVRPEFGQYIYVTNIKGLPDFSTHEQIQFWNDSNSAEVGATNIGSARVLGIDYHVGGATDDKNIYKLYIYDLLLGAYNLTDAGSVKFGTGSGIVLHKIKIPAAQSLLADDAVVTGTSSAGTIRHHVLSTGDAYIFKHLHTTLLCSYGQLIVNGATSATITSVESLVTASSNNTALFSIPVENIKELRSGANGVNASYTVWKKLQITTDATGAGSVGITVGSIASLEQSTIIGSYSGGVLPFARFSLDVSGTTLSIIPGATAQSTTVDVFVNINRATPATAVEGVKAVTVGSDVFAFNADLVLDRVDVISVTSVLSTADGDITSRYVLDNGQRDYYYDFGRLINISGLVPASGTITVAYTYYAHSSTGDYFSADSYKTLGTDYLARIPTYKSYTTGVVIDLVNKLDFRKARAATTDMIMPGTAFTSSVKYFVPRTDIITMDKSGQVKTISGIPAEFPKTPNTPTGEILLRTMYIPAYTSNITDVLNRVPHNRRFTMSDINVLNDRVANVEYYSTLNALERDLVSMDVIDPATGLNRYKTGFLVDNFKNPNIISDIYSDQFKAAYIGQTLRPHQEQVEITYTTNSTTGHQMTGDVISLPYTPVSLINQSTATRVINLNPYMVFSWSGTMTLNPPADSWIETENLSAVFNTVEETVVVNRTETVTIMDPFVVINTIVHPPPPPPVIPPPPVVDSGGGGSWEYNGGAGSTAPDSFGVGIGGSGGGFSDGSFGADSGTFSGNDSFGGGWP